MQYNNSTMDLRYTTFSSASKRTSWRKIISSLLSLSIIFSLCSCYKRKPATYYIDASFKEWVVFKKGSYWVYLNEKRQSEDSTFINMQTRDAISLPGQEGPDCFEGFYYDLSNGFISAVSGQRDYNESYASYSVFFPDEYSMTGLSTANLKIPVDESYHTPILVEKIDTMFLNNNKFTNVIHTRDTIKFFNNLQDDFYFVKNIGLIKFSIRTNSFDSTWSILRWHVIQ
jgi:hypothetical protein